MVLHWRHACSFAYTYTHIRIYTGGKSPASEWKLDTWNEKGERRETDWLTQGLSIRNARRAKNPFARCSFGVEVRGVRKTSELTFSWHFATHIRNSGTSWKTESVEIEDPEYAKPWKKHSKNPEHASKSAPRVAAHFSMRAPGSLSVFCAVFVWRSWPIIDDAFVGSASARLFTVISLKFKIPKQ
jgi:hypothetical protein